LTFLFGSPENAVDLSTFSFGSGSASNPADAKPIDFESPQFALGSANASFASVDGVEAALNDAALTRNLFDTSVEDGGAQDTAKDALLALAAMGSGQGSPAAAASTMSFDINPAASSAFDVSALLGGGDDVKELITAAATSGPGGGGGGGDGGGEEFALFKEPAAPKPKPAAGGKPRRKAKGRRKKTGGYAATGTSSAASASEEDWSTVSESESVGGGD
jgi:hypothetical protein